MAADVKPAAVRSVSHGCPVEAGTPRSLHLSWSGSMPLRRQGADHPRVCWPRAVRPNHRTSSSLAPCRDAESPTSTSPSSSCSGLSRASTSCGRSAQRCADKSGQLPHPGADKLVDGRPSPTMTGERARLAGTNRTVLGLTRPSTWMAGSLPGHDARREHRFFSVPSSVSLCLCGSRFGSLLGSPPFAAGLEDA
jgi:hypothetical protein